MSEVPVQEKYIMSEQEAKSFTAWMRMAGMPEVDIQRIIRESRM